MANSFEPSELKALQQIHRQLLALEQTAPTMWTEVAFAALKNSLSGLSLSPHPDVCKLAEIAKHLNPAMTPKQLASWIVPIERVLGRALRDDQFLVFSTDGTQSALPKLPLVYVLDNLRSAFNVGTLFRTAECFGVAHIFLTGYTPLPDQEKIAKTAMGTATLVEWTAADKILPLLSKLRSDGYHVVAFETTSHAVEIQENFTEKPTAFVFGNERFGLEPELLSACDEVRKISLRGTKNSLNVGVAAAIATYEFSRQSMLKSGSL
jgi:23S rRNA (guanosine2251-2'-O)-methyltransferase